MRTQISIVAALILASIGEVQANLVDLGYVWQNGGANPTDVTKWMQNSYGDGLGVDLVNLGRNVANDDAGKWVAGSGVLVPDSSTRPPITIDYQGTGGHSTASLTWDLTGTDYAMYFVTVRSGDSTGSGDNKYYRYHVYQVTGDVAAKVLVSYTDERNKLKNISHIDFFGAKAEAVPDGGATALLFAFAAGGIGLIRLRAKR